MNKTLINSEQAVIGSLLRDNDAFDEINDLDSSVFIRQDHRIIYKKICDFIQNGKPVDLILLAESLESQGDLDKVGGLAYISELVQCVNTTKNIKSHANSIQSAAKLRQISSLLNELSGLVESKTPVEMIAEKTENGLFNLLENKDTEKLAHIGVAVGEAIDWEDRDKTGIQTGLRDFDRLTGGFSAGNLIIVAGRPAMGKSSLCMGIAEHVSNSESTAIFSLEMTKREIATRFLNYHKHTIGKSEAVRHLSNLKLHIDDSAAVTISHIRSQCRKIKRKNGLSMVVVDYIQLMRGDGDNRTQEIGSISRGLKSIAKEFDIPVIALSQLSRKVDDRSDKRPLMSDLRDSGEIEQDADMIIFVYRDEEYDENSTFKGIAELICRKNRNGSTGDVQVKFDGPLIRFSDYNGERVLRVVKTDLKRASDRGFY